MEYTYAIINPDATSNLQLRHFLAEYEDFSFVALAKNADDGINTILKFSPDIVFINLNEKAPTFFQMAGELHQYLEQIPMLIGVSQSKNYAYEAIKNSFFDYWLMPYNEFDIRKSLFRLKKQRPKEDEAKTLVLKSYSDFRYLDLDEILYLQADNNATDVVMRDGSITSSLRTLKSFEESLPINFVRIHQSYIVNTKYISRINYGKSICAFTSGDRQLPFSKTYRQNVDSLKKRLSKNAITTLN